MAVIAGALLLTGCARTVSGDAIPAAGVVLSSTQSTGSSTTGSQATGAATGQSGTTSSTTSTAPSAIPPTSSAGTPTPALTPTSPGTTTSTPGSTTPTATPPAIKWLLPAQSTVKSKLNAFGNLEAGLGKPYEITWTAKKTTALRFIVDSATIDGRCETPTKPENGHFLILGVRVQLGDATADDLGDSRIGFTGQYWTAFDAKNVAEVGTTSSAAGSCITSTTGFPYTTDLAPGKVYSGKIALDVSSTKGTVVLMDGVSGGWIYNYG